MGPQPFAQLRCHYARRRALIFPGEEDFGIVPIEAMASGRPVIAYGRGGAVESGVTGLLFEEQSVEALTEAVRQFSRQRFLDRMAARFRALLNGSRQAAAHGDSAATERSG